MLTCVPSVGTILSNYITAFNLKLKVYRDDGKKIRFTAKERRWLVRIVA